MGTKEYLNGGHFGIRCIASFELPLVALYFSLLSNRDIRQLDFLFT